MKKFHLHLVSDSTGETVSNLARAAIVQFENIEPIEHIWPLVRTETQMEKVLKAIEENPGIVMYTVVKKDIRDMLKKKCEELKLPCIAILARVISELSIYLGVESNPFPGKQHELDEEYFRRVDAINYTISHDDGQITRDLEEADIVLVGVSRTSKSPTCVYLANKGYRVANIPFVLNCPLPDNLFTVKKPLIIGLTINSERLLHIRKNRLLHLNEQHETNYIDVDSVKEEITAARKLFLKHNWPIIDVTKRSVEETAANIIQIYNERKL